VWFEANSNQVFEFLTMDRSTICLFDVDGTVTDPRQVWYPAQMVLLSKRF